MMHTVKGFSVIDETEVDVFLEFLCFLYDPANVCNLITGSSAFSQPSLDFWKFLVHIMLKPGMQDLSMTILAWEMSATVRWLAHSLVLPFLETGMTADIFQSYGHSGSSRFADILSGTLS